MLSSLRDRVNSIPASTASALATAAVAIVLLVLLGNQSLAIYRAAGFAPHFETVKAVAPHSVNTQYNATDITAQNLFGRSASDPSQLRDSNLPTTDLAVTLRGVFTSSNPRNASAIIERPDGQTRSYQVNSLVFGQTSLHAVFNDRIVLSTNGRLETLRFPEPTQEQSGTGKGTATAALDQVPKTVKDLVQNNMSSEEIQQTARQLSSSAMTPEQRKALIRQRLLELRNRARARKQNP